jgi:hypothetical protein
MATRAEDDRRIRGTSAPVRAARSRRDEGCVQETEVIAYLATVVAVLIAAKIDDSLDGHGAWTLVTALTIGYLVSRGLAKSGSRHHEDRDTI